MFVNKGKVRDIIIIISITGGEGRRVKNGKGDDFGNCNKYGRLNS